MQFFKDIIERSAFGVCSFVGERLGINSSRIRMYFIYTSFVALGSPIVLYLFAAFWLNIRKCFRHSLN
ncbi:MAG: PspC family transcriptional regulator [Saprospiraceae bacterium]|nr:PspC family transcriptional regulator [Saprospiraceae bacterium]